MEDRKRQRQEISKLQELVAVTNPGTEEQGTPTYLESPAAEGFQGRAEGGFGFAVPGVLPRGGGGQMLGHRHPSAAVGRRRGYVLARYPIHLHDLITLSPLVSPSDLRPL